MSRPVRRCAIYTRKSSEEGLDQAFNSLDAQREACAAYVKSQASEGWRPIKTLYDDGGVSGGSMERPALRRLLADIARGEVEVVVVYKIDRLTRSLADFARMVELFDRHNVSFVSVTQAFNTTNSMGRLTLNVLLSFAQFEREVTGERIRDKIAASKAKGMWMGGNLPLGYDLPLAGTRALVVNPAEADLVREIFQRYLDLRSVHKLRASLDAEGIRSKQRTSARGRTIGDQPFSRGALFHLLRNRVYLGVIVHKDKTHPGMHPAIVDEDLFKAVQHQLDANVQRTGPSRSTIARSPLTGRIFDANGQLMSPVFAYGKGGKLYRYYVSASLQQGRPFHGGDDAVRRIPAAALEELIAAIVERIANPRAGQPLDLVTRIDVRPDGLQLMLAVTSSIDAVRARLLRGEEVRPVPADPAQLQLFAPIRMRLRGGRTSISTGAGATRRPEPTLVNALRTAHAMLAIDTCGMPTLDAAPDSPWRRRLVRLAFLAPDLQDAILTGRQPPELTLARLMECALQIGWDAQRRTLFDASDPSSGSDHRAGVPTDRPTAEHA